MSKLKQQSGFTLIEMLVTVVVSSVLVIILMQIMMLTLKANVDLETRSRYQYESYIMSESIRDFIFDLKPQEVELITDNSSETIIEIRHLYGYTTNDQNQIVEDPTLITDILRLDKEFGNLYYNGTLVNDNSVSLGPNSEIKWISIDPTVCNLTVSECDEGILELTLEIIVSLPDGGTLTPQVFVTRILI